jgi:hypothetical protein
VGGGWGVNIENNIDKKEISPWSRGAEKKKSDVPTYLLFLSFFEVFSTDFRKYFYGVFELLMQRKGQKRD